MDSNSMYALASALIMSFSAVGPGFAQGMTAKSAMESIARQPDAAGNIRSTLIVALALMEALAIYGLLVAFMLVSKIA